LAASQWDGENREVGLVGMTEKGIWETGMDLAAQYAAQWE